MSQFFTLDKPKGNIAYIRKDGDIITIVSKNGRQLIAPGALDPNEFPLTEVDEETAFKLVKPEKTPDRVIEAVVVETRSGTLNAPTPPGSITLQKIDDISEALDRRFKQGTLNTPADIRDVLINALGRTPGPPTP